MTKLPSVSGKKCIKALQKAGFSVKRQEGSHVTLRRNEPFTQIVVPLHDELDRGTLRSIIRLSGLSVDQFSSLL